jgi:hypothetical protein
MAGGTPPKLLWGIRQELIVGSLFENEITAFRLAQDRGKRVRMIERPVLDDGEQAIVDTFWALRRLAPNSNEVVPLSDMLAYLSLTDYQREELEILRTLDSQYLQTIAEMNPKRRANLAKRPQHLSLVKDEDREE